MKYDITDSDLQFIIKHLTHSANVYITFYESGAQEYPYELVKEVADRMNSIITDLKAQKDS